MAGAFRSMTLTAAIFAATTAASQAVTINSGASRPDGGVAIALDPDVFVASGGPGSGGSVIGDPTDVSTKNTRSPRPYGRFDPLGGFWVDSNDNPSVVWNLASEQPIKSVTFALTDAFDQKRSRDLGESFFNLTVDDATWSIDTRDENGTLNWIEVLFDEPTDSASLLFETRLNDGWGVSQAKVAPVPVPPALLLIGSGLALLGFARRRRKDRPAA
ncbi:MAG: hypothetical protein H0T41_11990 [Rhodobacteraceae bacterium]|nr:hypothetical protein [Paracoccaceae bacterium]